MTPTQTTRTTISRAHGLLLSHVVLVGKRGARGRALVFTLSARARVQITLARRGRPLLRVTLNASRGQIRYSLTSLLRGRHLAAGAYALTVRAGGRTVTVRLPA